MTCLVCGSDALEELLAYRDLSRITSDCRSFKVGGRLFDCRDCGAVQKINDANWRADCDKIYDEYDVYSVSKGQEQAVRSGLSDDLYGKRSDLVLDQLTQVLSLPSTGSFLDFGCGSGVSSIAVSNRLDGWVIDGFDLDRRMESSLQSISGFNRLYVESLDSIPTQYDLIMLTHVLEHLPTPIETLRNLAGLLKPNGAIVVQVPNRVENEYDLLVADHLLHFDQNSLSAICRSAGLGAMAIADDWVMKELSLVAVKTESDCEDFECYETTKFVRPSAQIERLRHAADSVRNLANHENLGFFGTSLVAVWLAKELGREPDFYVDEDPAKIGQLLNDREILSPDEVPSGATIVAAMAVGPGRLVVERYSALGLDMVLPI